MKTIIMASIFIMIILNLIMMIINVISKKNNQWSWKKIPIRMRFWPKEIRSTTFLITILLNCCSFLNFWCSNCFNFTILHYYKLININSSIFNHIIVFSSSNCSIMLRVLQGMLEWAE